MSKKAKISVQPVKKVPANKDGWSDFKEWLGLDPFAKSGNGVPKPQKLVNRKGFESHGGE